MSEQEECPSYYLGVWIPWSLRPNWDQVEACWWRKGVEAALESTIRKESK